MIIQRLPRVVVWCNKLHLSKVITLALFLRWHFDFWSSESADSVVFTYDRSHICDHIWSFRIWKLFVVIHHGERLFWNSKNQRCFRLNSLLAAFVPMVIPCGPISFIKIESFCKLFWINKYCPGFDKFRTRLHKKFLPRTKWNHPNCTNESKMASWLRFVFKPAESTWRAWQPAKSPISKSMQLGREFGFGIKILSFYW